MAFDPFSQPIDYVILGGSRTPGFAKIVGLSKTFNWESRKGDAVSGATKLLKGRALAPFSISVKLFDAADMAAWETLVKTLSYPDTSKATSVKGVDIVHPIATMYGIKAVTIQKFVQPEQNDDGSWEASIEVEEYREPVVTVRKASGSTTPTKPEEVDPILNNPELLAATRELEIQRALNKAAGA